MAQVLTNDQHYKDIANILRKEGPYYNDTFRPAEMAEKIQNTIYFAYDQGVNYGHADGVQVGIEQGKKDEYNRFWDAFQEGGKKSDYRAAFSGTGWTEDTLKPKYPIKIIETKTTQRYALQMFMYLNRNSEGPHFDMTEICKMVDFSECLNPQGIFYNAKVKNITVNFGKATSLHETFRCGDSGEIDNVTLTVSSDCQNYNNAFYRCAYLTNLTFTEGSEIAATIDFQYSPLTKQSILSILNALSTTATGKTATFKKTAVDAAFETSSGAVDGSSSPEWLQLTQQDHANWSFSLI